MFKPIEPNNEKACRILSELRASIVIAGGCEMSNERLKMMTLEDLLSIAVCNGIEIKFKPLIRD